MRERPILFSAPMVRAILDGRKSQTRRICKGQRELSSAADFRFDECPYGQPGDRLWVKEAYRLCAEADQVKARDTDSAYRVWREADQPHQPGAGKLRPSIFMPRWASRITLEITGVRVERLQAMSSSEAEAEGVFRVDIGSGYPPKFGANAFTWADAVEQQAECHGDPRLAYRDLWEQINGTGAWNANPWVWVVEFRRVAPCPA